MVPYPGCSDGSTVPFAPNCATNEGLLHLAPKFHFAKNCAKPVPRWACKPKIQIYYYWST